MAKVLLGIDNGCTMSKAALFTLEGKELAVAARKTKTLSPHPGHLERNCEELWQATAAAIREVLAKSRVAPGDIAAAACAGHGNGLYLVDKEGRPVRDAILSTDSRARDIVDRWLAEGVDRRVRPKTMQSLWAAQPNALLAWLKKHEPETIRRAGWVLMCKDYVRFRLTGRVAAELTDFSGTSLMDVAAGKFDPAVLEAFGIGDLAHLLPPLVRSADVCGEVTPGAARDTGLRAGTPVAGGMFDIDACGLATGLVDERQICMIAGTWSCNQYIATRPVVDDVFMTSCYSIPGYYLMLEGSATSASNLEWFVTEFFGAEREQAAREGRSVYDVTNDLVAATRPDAAPIVFLPFLYGSHASADAKAALLGLSGWHTRGDVLRAIYEGVAFSHRWHVERLLQFRPRPEAICLTGGAARSPVWVRIFADIFQTPIRLPDGTELGALGGAIAAGVAAGCFKDFREAVGAMVHVSRTQAPDPSPAGVYEAKYARYKRAVAALDPVWRSLS